VTEGPLRVLAVDLGATSVRVAAVDLEASVPAVDIIHRRSHRPVRHDDGSLRWVWPAIVATVEQGLAAGIDTGPVASIGIDGWGVDYGLLDEDDRLLSLPYSYRDPRTGGWRDLVGRIGAAEMYRTTGVQLMAINTIFQLAAHDPAEVGRAHRLLLLPDLLLHHLTGFVGAERSNASTTALLDLDTGDWSPRLAGAAGVAPELLPTVVDAGRLVGEWQGIPVHTVGSHDTASAFVAMPGRPRPGTALVSSGTWALVGAERPRADTSEAARSANFSNEAGALGGVRFLKNVTGLWLVEQCRPGWGDPSMSDLATEAAEATPGPVFDAADERFLAPTDMAAEIRDAAGLAADVPRGVVVRTALESLACGVASVLAELATLTGAPGDDLFVVGGGANNEQLDRLIADRTGARLTVGSTEATALGNAVVQGIALGRFRDLADARTWVAAGALRL
jgi:rhamnulokinase